MKGITLVGPMGAGKTTIGRLLSKELDFLFIDSDREIESRTGAAISWIFDVEGEVGFRDREQAIIEDICQTNTNGFVLATGGGAILREQTRRILSEKTTVIYLHASVEQQIARTAKDRHRPLLQVDNPEKVLRELIAIREPFYREVAHIEVVTDERPPRFLIQYILELLSL
ncbi:shikimate kinase AroK [Entomomonas moraniae]|uniref:Shikimate kinase n=1 Tax=Entomomonas moraniae TaxID=2213226 RepID=A0A3S9XBA8_9GAMM|nr:shikimate kinase AroK [Entomomonas moraniae]AZS49675.1 shikimate kinase AroK [Entomomonas moraniae]